MSHEPALARLRRGIRVVGAVLVLLGASGAGVSTSSAQEEDTTAFTVTADAQAASVRVSLPDAGLVVGEEVANVAPARANTRLDNFGTSSAYAAAGYPGDSLVAGPGTVIGVLSGTEGFRELVPLLPPVPAYPLLAQTDSLNPSVSNQAGAYRLEASTAEHESVAEALVGAEESGLTAGSLRALSRTAYDADTHTASAEALSEHNGMRIGELLDVSQRTTGTISMAPGGTPQLITETFFGVTVADSFPLGFGPGGLQVPAGTSPVERAVLDSILASLANDGVILEYIPEQRAEDGRSVTSAGMRITMPVPAGGDIGDVVVALTLGQVALSVSASSLPVEPFGGVISSAPLPAAGAAAPSPAPAAGRPVVATPALAAPVAVGSAPAAAPASQASATPVPITLSMSTFYLALVGAGIAALASSRLLGLLAIRLKLRGAVA